MQTGQVLVVVSFVVLMLVVRRFLKHPLFQGSTSQEQRPWELLLNVVGVLWVTSLIAFDRLLRAGGLARQFQIALYIAVVALLGLATIWAFYRWLRAADELIRRIETEAVALALGLGTVGIIAASQLESAGIGPNAVAAIDPSGRILMIVFLGYAISRIVTYLRYR